MGGVCLGVSIHTFPRLRYIVIMVRYSNSVISKNLNLQMKKRKSVMDDLLDFSSSPDMIFSNKTDRNTNLSRKLFKTTKKVRQYDFISHFIDNQD